MPVYTDGRILDQEESYISDMTSPNLNSSDDSYTTGKLRNTTENEKRLYFLKTQIKVTEIYYHNDLVKLLALFQPSSTRNIVSQQKKGSVDSFSTLGGTGFNKSHYSASKFKHKYKQASTKHDANYMVLLATSFMIKHGELIQYLELSTVNDPNFFSMFIDWLKEVSIIYDKYISSYNFKANQSDIFLEPINRVKFFIDLLYSLLNFYSEELIDSYTIALEELFIHYFRLWFKFDHNYNREKNNNRRIIRSIQLNEVRNLISYEIEPCHFEEAAVIQRSFCKLSMQHPRTIYGSTATSNTTQNVEIMLMKNPDAISTGKDFKKSMSSLAICSIRPTEKKNTAVRSLLFPPFKINELSIISLTKNCLILTPSPSMKSKTDNLDLLDYEIIIKLYSESNIILKWKTYFEILFPYLGINSLYTHHNDAFGDVFSNLKRFSSNLFGLNSNPSEKEHTLDNESVQIPIRLFSNQDMRQLSIVTRKNRKSPNVFNTSSGATTPYTHSVRRHSQNRLSFESLSMQVIKFDKRGSALSDRSTLVGSEDILLLSEFDNQSEQSKSNFEIKMDFIFPFNICGYRNTKRREKCSFFQN